MAVASAGSLSPDHSAPPSIARSSATFGPRGMNFSPRRRSSSSDRSKAVEAATAANTSTNSQTNVATQPAVPEVSINGAPLRTPRPPKTVIGPTEAADEGGWGSNFWVTLVDPQQPARLPPNEAGEWWELGDESRGGLPYYYQTKTGETVWERPEGFVIPLGIIQNTSLGRRLSRTVFHRSSIIASDNRVSIIQEIPAKENHRSIYDEPIRNSRRRSRSYDRQLTVQPTAGKLSSTSSVTAKPVMPVRRSSYADQFSQNAASPATSSSSRTGHGASMTLPQLPPIPGSPYNTDADPASPPDSPVSKHSSSSGSRGKGRTSRSRESPAKMTPPRIRATTYTTVVPQRSPPPQSLTAAMELLSGPARRSVSEGARVDAGPAPGAPQLTLNLGIGENGRVSGAGSSPITPTRTSSNGRDPFARPPPSPSRPIPAAPRSVSGREISGPVVNHDAAHSMNPVQNRAQGLPIPVEARPRPPPRAGSTTLASGYVQPPPPFFARAKRTLSLSARFSASSSSLLSKRTLSSSLSRRPPASSATYPILPDDLASDIQQFSESQYARQYFSTHRTGFIFRRTVPVEQMMTWQKGPLSSPLLTLNRPLKVDAVKIFRVIQRIMGDREREEGANAGGKSGRGVGTSSISSNWLLEEERWLLGEGLTHGELRDEIYCQLMKQLSGNPSQDGVFKGWQMLCVLLITFPPSKNFETFLRAFIQQHTTQQEGRVDVMAKHCLKRLEAIAKKGPRGKPPSIAEIETASDAAFNPSTFGESLDAIIRLQERNYPHQKVPIILPFLADGMLALGGTKSEGIFRVPGDSDSISELKLRIDRGYYTLDDIEDPNILASLMKLWLRELCDPLVPEEMYNDCIANSKDPATCIQMVHRLPTVNRRVVLFVISFLQLFLKDEIQAVTKMTPANLALVMAPNLLRCNSDSMSVVFTNAQYEQIFVYNLLLHLKCNEIDADYTPTHGLQNSNIGTTRPRDSRSRVRR
ncbi:hypothetical protein HWV62_16118 [Athelia sp. TMB]|nr:hypothetical protein HWV62_16118 [Athelia sp. TMB]